MLYVNGESCDTMADVTTRKQGHTQEPQDLSVRPTSEDLQPPSSSTLGAKTLVQGHLKYIKTKGVETSQKWGEEYNLRL